MSPSRSLSRPWADRCGAKNLARKARRTLRQNKYGIPQITQIEERIKYGVPGSLGFIKAQNQT